MVAIVTDSAANLPDALVRDFGIEVVPMYLMLGEGVYRDGVDLAPQDLYRTLGTEGVVASTSTPSPPDFLEAYRRSGEQEIVCVTVASSMSGAHQQARIAAEEFGGRVEVVDSLCASMAEGFVALEAARRAADEGTIDQVAEHAADVAGRVRICATIASFEFLRRSGRVNALQAYAATMLDIKPVFRMQGGQVWAVGRPRTRRRAVDKVLEVTLAQIDERPAHVAAIHADAEPEARDLLERISARATVVESVVTAVTPVIGAHTGPGLVGTAWFCD
jgi:fatty acid kinase fatty acid binding subunit